MAAFIAGVAGSVHCLAMCGGFSAALGMQARRVAVTPAGTLMQTALYHVGRLISYGVAGAACGALGALLLQALPVHELNQPLRMAAGALMLLMGVQLFTGRALLAPIEALGRRCWQQLAPLSQSAMDQGPHLRALLFGMLWGWLPCGMVYSMLVLGVLGGTAINGAAVMLAFGLGTLPMMLSAGLLAAQWARCDRDQWRWIGGITLMLLGVWTMWIAQAHAH